MNKKIKLLSIILTLIFIISFLFVKKENFSFQLKGNGIDFNGFSISDNIVKFNNYIKTKIFKINDLTIKKNIIEGNGDFNFNGVLKINGNLKGLKKICIDGACLEKQHIDMLIGKRPLFIKSEKNNKYLGNFDTEHTHGQNTNIANADDHSHHIENHKMNGLGMFFGGKGDFEKIQIEL